MARENTTSSPEQATARYSGNSSGEVTLLQLWDVLWGQKWFLIGITSAFAVASIVLALLLTPKYRSDVLLAPVSAEETPNLLEQVSGLANLAGVSLGGASESRNSIAILRSRAFIRSFIEDFDLMKVMYTEKWDAANDRWLSSAPADRPQLNEAVEDFQKYIFSVQEDPSTGLVQIAIEWSDPVQAAEWVNELASRINQESRDRAIREAERNLRYLHAQLEEAKFVELQTAIARLIENEIKTLMLARARDEYAFKIIDPGIVPTQKVRPRRALMVVSSTAIGGFLAVLLSLLRHNVRREIRSRSSAS